jgi:SAM-dependent methyltransferase
MKVGRNDPCWCGSGLKYKHCHYELDTAPSDKRVSVARKIYDRSWQKNATHYASQGCYEWMASFLRPFAPKRILDIGCGEGSGLLALLAVLGSNETTIISLEENSDCIHTTEEHLHSKGYETSVIYRMHAEPIADRQHMLEIEPGKLPERSGISLIESDILLLDEELFAFLSSVPRFDAVTLWLVGTHFARQECGNIATLQIKTSGEYRLRVQNKVYELSDRFLRSGGVLQIVDRGEVPNTEHLENDFLNAHKEQASVTSLKAKSLNYLVYNEPGGSRKVAMQATVGKSGRTPDLSRFAMISVTSVKP